jgi:hypothetical protein
MMPAMLAAELVVAVAIRQQQAELGGDARPGLVLQNALAPHVLEERDGTACAS